MTQQQVDPRIERSRVAILSAARELLAEGGAAAVTVDAITRRSRVARSTLYRHYRTMTELIVAAFEGLVPAAAPAAATGANAVRERLRALLTQLAAWMRDTPVMTSVVALLNVTEHEQPELKQLIVTRYQAIFGELLDYHQLTGDLRAELPHDVAIAELLGPLLLQALVDRTRLSEAFCDHVVDDFLAAHGRTA